MHRSLLTALFVMAALQLAPVADACTCTFPPTIEQSLELREVIVLATVKDIVLEGGPGPLGCDGFYRVTLNASEYWKGDPNAVLEVVTPQDSGCCGFYFEIDEEYLIFADQNGDGLAETSLCIGNKYSRNAEAELEKLGPGITPTLPSSWGSLKTRYGGTN